MFVVKASYQGETRKFSLAQSSFPAFDVLQTQLARLFDIETAFYLSDLQFFPESGSRVVVGSVAYDETMYNDLVSPFRGQMWPNGLLRFQVASMGSAPLLHPSVIGTPRSVYDLRSTPIPRPTPRHPNSSAGDSTALASHRSSMISQSSQQSCCSVAEGREEVKHLMDNFLKDFNNIMSSNFGEVPDGASTQPRSISPETVTAEPPSNVEDTADVTVPGAFYHPTYISPKPKAAVHRGVSCDFCGTRNIRGIRYHCLQCPDFDLCEECVKERGAKSAHQVVAGRGQNAEPHSFEEIERPGQRATRTVPQAQAQAQATGSTARTAVSARSASGSVVHSNVLCDLCNKTVVGTRHKCLDCPDFDLCDTCYPRAEREHPAHQFFDITIPGRVIVHRVQDRVEAPSAQSSSSPASPVVHAATCDLCDSQIRGIRHKCLTCPDFDTCGSCFSIVSEHHPKHAFVKVMENQILTSRDPGLLKRHSARCDECGEQIKGIRFKCMHPTCPDYDLCAKCEALPIEVHPSTHPLLKMKDPNTIIPTVYRVGGTSLVDPEPIRAETMGIAVATEPEPERTDASVHTEKGVNLADASVFTESNVSDASVATVAQEQVALEASCPALPRLPTPPNFALEVPKEEAPVRELEPETSLPEVLAESSSFISAFIKKFPQLQEDKPDDKPKEEIISCSYIRDVNVEDGQSFPAGAEFIKSWRVKNNGNVAWPENTRLTFVAGDRMPAFNGAPLSYSVGAVGAGEEVDVSAYDLKAPEVAGKYVSYWRLSDGYKPFGTSMWCDINVVVSSGPSSLGEPSQTASLNSSQVIMPELSQKRSLSVDTTERVVSADDVEEARSVPSTPSVTTDYSTSESLYNDFENSSDDELWEASREHAAPASPAADTARAAVRIDPEYVVLYDETSGDETW